MLVFLMIRLDVLKLGSNKKGIFSKEFICIFLFHLLENKRQHLELVSLCGNMVGS